MLTEKQQKLYDSILKVLKKKGIRLTAVRSEIIKILILSSHPTAPLIINNLKEKYWFVNAASVYNTLDLLLEEHIVSATTFNGKQICYEIIELDTIHFSCIKCHQIFHASPKESEKQIALLLDQLAKEINFSMDHFKIEGHGICQNCLINQ